MRYYLRTARTRQQLANCRQQRLWNGNYRLPFLPTHGGLILGNLPFFK